MIAAVSILAIFAVLGFVIWCISQDLLSHQDDIYELKADVSQLKEKLKDLEGVNLWREDL